MKNSSSTDESAKTKYIDVNGVQIAYRTIGSESAIPLLCLQHFTGNMDGWDLLIINGLSKNRQVILFDNAGVGESAGSTPNTVSAMANDTLAFLKAMNIKKVDLLGFSLGGFISQLIMKDEPELVRKAILVGTCQQGGEGISNFRDYVNGSANIEGAERYLYFFFEKSGRSRALVLFRRHLRSGGLITCSLSVYYTTSGEGGKGVTRTPFTAAILVLEMTDRHSVIFYLMLAAMVANLIALTVDRRSFYDHIKKQYLKELSLEDRKGSTGTAIHGN